MATDLKPAPDASVTELVSGIVSDAQELIKQQFELLKHEVRDDLRKTRDAGLCIGFGALVGLVGMALLICMLVFMLHELAGLPLWASYGIGAGVALLISGVLISIGMYKFSSFNPLPDQTAQALKENVQWITQPK
jgi:hypothetical protein